MALSSLLLNIHSKNRINKDAEKTASHTYIVNLYLL